MILRCLTASNPCSSIRIPCSLRRLTVPRLARKSMLPARRRPCFARSTGATTFSVPPVQCSPVSLEGSPKRRKWMQMDSRSHRMIQTGRPTRPARDQSILRRKRKRALYRRFLVSLGVRRRNPTRPSLSRRREIRHDQDNLVSTEEIRPGDQSVSKSEQHSQLHGRPPQQPCVCLFWRQKVSRSHLFVPASAVVGSAALRAQQLKKRIDSPGSLGGRPGTVLFPAREIVRRSRQPGALRDLSAQGQGRRLQGAVGC